MFGEIPKDPTPEDTPRLRKMRRDGVEIMEPDRERAIRESVQALREGHAPDTLREIVRRISAPASPEDSEGEVEPVDSRVLPAREALEVIVYWANTKATDPEDRRNISWCRSRIISALQFLTRAVENLQRELVEALADPENTVESTVEVGSLGGMSGYVTLPGDCEWGPGTPVRITRAGPGAEGGPDE
jgi:hypothetical protein